MGEDLLSRRDRKKYDNWIRRLFYLLVPIFIIWIMYTNTIYIGQDIFDVINLILDGLIAVFLFTGLFSLIFYGKCGLIKITNVLEFLLLISLILTILTLIVGYMFFNPIFKSIFNTYIPGLNPNLILPLTFILLIISYLGGFIFLLLESFGLVSLIAIFQRKYTPGIIRDVKDITNKLKSDDFWNNIYHRFLRWIFQIPSVLNTEKIEVQKKVSRKGFPWKKFEKAFFLEIIVAVVIALYISLNPLLLEDRTLNELFALTSSISYFIPVLVISIFIFLKLDVKIPGPSGYFLLYDGLRSGILRILIIISTVLIFLRLAIETVSIDILIYSFSFYFIGFLINSVFITFIYFGYFENALAKDIIDNLDDI